MPYGNIRAGLECNDPEVILSGPADTGKTLGVLNKLHRIANHYPDASIIVLRKKQRDVYPTVLETFTEKVLGSNHSLLVYGGEKPEWFDYSNGSRILIAGLYGSSENQVAGKVLSGEFDVIYCNQVEELSLADWETLLSRCTGRAGHVPHPQVIGDCNPAHPTHWIKARAKSGLLTLFETTHRDNPELYDQETGEITKEGELRLGKLRRLTGSRLQRLFYGLWKSPEGAIYSIYDEEVHKVKAFPIPNLWPRFVGVDPVGAYVAALWIALDPQSQMLHVYREYAEPFGIPTREHCKKILKLSRRETIFYWVGGGPSERQARLDFKSHGIPLACPAFGDVWAGIDRINELLTDNALVIHDTCPHLLNDVPNYRRVVKDGEATEKIADKDHYHFADALRYGLVGPEGGGEKTQLSYNPVRIGRY